MGWKQRQRRSLILLWATHPNDVSWTGNMINIFGRSKRNYEHPPQMIMDESSQVLLHFQENIIFKISTYDRTKIAVVFGKTPAARNPPVEKSRKTISYHYRRPSEIKSWSMIVFGLLHEQYEQDESHCDAILIFFFFVIVPNQRRARRNPFTKDIQYRKWNELNT